MVPHRKVSATRLDWFNIGADNPSHHFISRYSRRRPHRSKFSRRMLPRLPPKKSRNRSVRHTPSPISRRVVLHICVCFAPRNLHSSPVRRNYACNPSPGLLTATPASSVRRAAALHSGQRISPADLEEAMTFRGILIPKNPFCHALRGNMKPGEMP